MTDSRVAAGRALLERVSDPLTTPREVHEVVTGLLAYGEERLRINTGVMGERDALRAAARQPDVVDLAAVDTTALLAEIARRTA